MRSATRMRAPTGADLREIAWSATGGDATDAFGYRHGGRPNREDCYGLTKSDLHRAALEHDATLFERTAVDLWDGATRNDWYLSQREYVFKAGKTRALDIPGEQKRLVACYARARLIEIVDATGGLAPAVVGFRRFDELFDRGRSDGATAQDAFASRTLCLLRRYGPYAVSVDLEDAFGRLPHRAIHEALRARGVVRADRSRLIDLARVNSRCRDGRVVRSGDEGVEQGGPLSPMLFNVVLDHLFQIVYGQGPVAAAGYGDDVVLVAPTEQSARAAFERFRLCARGLGFENVRTLGGSDPKRSRVADTRIEPVEIIKTFLVSPIEIRLTPKHEQLLQRRPSESVSSLRRRCPHKTVSKSYFAELLGRGATTPRHHRPDGPGEVGEKVGGSLVGSSPSNREPKGDGSIGSLGEGEMVSLSSSRSDSLIDGSDQGVVEASEPRLELGCLNLYVTPHPQPAGSSTRKGTTTTVSSRGHRSRCLSGGGGGPSTPASVHTVRRLRPEHLADLGAGRRVRAGDAYQGAVLDLRQLDTLPVSRLAFAVAQCARLGSTRGVARLLVDPTSQWVTELELFRVPSIAGWEPVRHEEDREGRVLVLRRVAHRTPARRATAAPDAELTVRSFKICPADRRLVVVGLARREAVWAESVKVDTLTPRDAYRRALAVVLDGQDPTTVAVPAVGGLSGELVSGDEAPRRLVSGTAAMHVLGRWLWRREAAWLLGARVLKEPATRP